MSEKKWIEAENHIKESLWNYNLEHGNPKVMCGFALQGIKSLQARYDNLERTDELFEQMMGVE